MRVSKPPAERRAELIVAARKLFDIKGINSTRVSDIVKSIGVAQGVFYYYFASKDEIIGAVTAQVSEEFEKEAEGVLQSPKPFPQKLALFIEMYIGLIDQFLGDEETDLRSLNESSLSNPSLSLVQHSQTLFVNKLMLLVEQGVTNGYLNMEYPQQTVLVLLYGLRCLAADKLPERVQVYTIIEQALGLEKGSVAKYSGNLKEKFNRENDNEPTK